MTHPEHTTQGSVLLSCEHCGKSFADYPSHASRGRKYCSQECYFRARFGPKKPPVNPSGLCQCGCGTSVKTSVRYAFNHHTRLSGVDYTVEDRGYETPCWIWQLSRNTGGYGQITVDGRQGLAHRVLYIQKNGPISNDLDLDHLCRVRRCVNPDHLEPVTRGENVHRGASPNIVANRTGVCKNGHPLTGDNAVRKSNGCVQCRQCELDRKRRYYREGRPHADPRTYKAKKKSGE